MNKLTLIISYLVFYISFFVLNFARYFNLRKLFHLKAMKKNKNLNFHNLKGNKMSYTTINNMKMPMIGCKF